MDKIINFLLHLLTTISLIWSLIGVPAAIVFGIMGYKAKNNKARRRYWTYMGIGILGLVLFYGSLEIWKFWLLYQNVTSTYVY